MTHKTIWYALQTPDTMPIIGHCIARIENDRYIISRNQYINARKKARAAHPSEALRFPLIFYADAPVYAETSDRARCSYIGLLQTRRPRKCTNR